MSMLVLLVDSVVGSVMRSVKDFVDPPVRSYVVESVDDPVVESVGRSVCVGIRVGIHPR